IRGIVAMLTGPSDDRGAGRQSRGRRQRGRRGWRSRSRRGRGGDGGGWSQCCRMGGPSEDDTHIREARNTPEKGAGVQTSTEIPPKMRMVMKASKDHVN